MQIGQKVREYVLEDRLGGGGMGEVWRALHSALARRVAIKVMDPHLATDPEFEQRFIQEARAQAALHHPHILQVTDFFAEAGVYYLVMTLVEGKSLAERLTQSRGPLPFEDAIKIAHDVLSGLDYAHQHGVIHRDVKPSNILLDAASHAYLLDFGIALLVGQERHTRTGASLGTPHYMSPEQIQRPRSIDHRADVYSAGCVIYEMLAGRPPFLFAEGQEDATFVVQQAHVTQTPEPIRKWNPAIPPAVDAVVLRALAKDPGQRWNGCGEFLRALETRQGDTVFEAPKPAPTPGPPAPPSPAPSLNSPAPSHPGDQPFPWGRILTLAVGGVALVVLVLLASLKKDPAENANDAVVRADVAQAQATPPAVLPPVAEPPSASAASSPVPGPARSEAATYFSKAFLGTVGKYQIEMQLDRSGDSLRGHYLNPPRNRDTSLVGTVDSHGELTIDEYQNGEKHTGVFRGRFVGSSVLEMQGTWSKPDGALPMPFQLREIEK